jgi:glutathione S-transferase
MLTLAIKRLSYRSERIDSASGYLKSPGYLAMNPRGQVPVLRAGQAVIRESLAIMSFLDEVSPQPLLFGRDPFERARSWQDILDFENNMRPANTTLAQIVFRDQVRARAGELESATGVLAREIGSINALLEIHGTFGRGPIGAADIAIYPSIQWLRRALEREPGARLLAALRDLLERARALQSWERRIHAIDGYEATYPPHWHRT